MAYKRNSPQPVVEGGTGDTTLTDHGVLVGSGTSAIDALTVGTNGQLLIGATSADPAFASLTSTDSTINYTTGVNTLALDVNAGLKITTGFEAWTGAGSYFDDTTLGSFTVLRGGTGYINSKPITWTGPQTVTGLTAGNTYWIYIDSTGTIGKTSTFTNSLFTDNIVLFECLRDSTPVTNNQITVKENHPFNFQVMPSVYLHKTIGCVIENNNNGANITLNGTQKIQINGADELSDHGLYTTIPDSGGVAVTFRKMYTTAAGKWATYTNTDTFTGHWNNAGTPTALTAGRFAIYTLYVSKDSLNTATPFYFAVLDTSEYTNLTNANNAISNGTTAKATNELASLEVSQLGYIIYRESTAAIVQVTISKSTLKQTLSTGGTNTASLVNTSVTNFNNVLSSSDTNVQAALDTLDDFGSGTGNQTVNLYTGAGVKTVTLGSTNTTSATTVQSGSTGISITSATANGPITIASGTGTIGIATSATASTVNVGTGAGVKTCAFGSTNTSSSTAINCGTGGFTLTSASGNIISSTAPGVLTLLNDLDVTEGGTGVSTLTSHGILMGNGAGDIQATAEPSNGQLLIGSTGNFPVLSTLTAGTGIGISNAAGSITISYTGAAGFSWTTATGDTTIAVNTGYITKHSTPANEVTYTLPATSVVGDIVRIVGYTAGGWKIAQGSGQQIFFGSSATTSGASGYLEFTNAKDCIEMVCVTANTEWSIMSSQGNITVA